MAQWVTEANGYREPRVGTEGPAAEAPRTVFAMIKDTVAKFPTRPAICFKEPVPGKSIDETNFSTWTWSEYYQNIIQTAKSMIQLGLQPHDCINIIGFNSKEWFLSQFGAMAAGGIPAGIYPTNLPEGCKYITQHSESKIVCVENNKQLQKYIQMGKECKSLRTIVVWAEEPEVANIGRNIKVYSWQQFMDLGKSIPDEMVEERITGHKPGNCCSLIYTSGTTGPPKAVMISNDNVTWTVKTMSMDMPLLSENDRAVSFLPLSHIAAQLLDFYLPMCYGGCVYFAQPDALKGSLGKTLKEVQPTYFFGVPRVWEKIYDKMQEIGRSVTGIKKSISTWAKQKGTEKNQLAQYGRGGGAPCGYSFAKVVAFKKVKAALGFTQCNYFCVGAAPMSLEIFKYFASLDIPIFEVFGQSESTGTHTVNTTAAWRLGTVGRPLNGSENKIDEKTGEYCFRSRNVFMGYMKMPDKTEETIDSEGWLHTGDTVKIDDDGFVSIVGRIKELIITAGGENIPPVLIEDQFKKAMPALSNCMVIGDKRKYLAIVLTLQLKPADDGTFTEELTGESLATSKKIGSQATLVSHVIEDPLWKKYFDDGMKAANKAATSSAQTVKKWVLVPTDFSEKEGMLTPTLKLKRGPTAEIFSDAIESMY